MHFFKLCKILADHDQCIQWCKEHNLLASSKKCPRENCGNSWTWTRRASSRNGNEWRCSRRNCNGMASVRIENTWKGVKQSLPHTGTSKDLFESYLREWLWRQHYGDDPFGNINQAHGTEFEKGIEIEGQKTR